MDERDPAKVRAEINRLDGFNVFRTCLTCENPVPSEGSDIRWSWTYQFPMWFWIALMRELHRQYSSAFICVASCTQYLGSSFTKTTLSISNMKVSEVGKVTYENWLVIPYPQCLLRTVYSLLQSAWIQFSHKLLIMCNKVFPGNHLKEYISQCNIDCACVLIEPLFM